MSFKRRLNVERFQLRLPNVNVVMALKMKRVVKPEEFTGIVRKLMERHPFLNVKVIFDEEDIAYFTPRKEKEILAIHREEDWQEVVKEELTHRFTLDGPFIRFTLVEKEVTTIIINSHHIICDGLSIVYLAEDMAELLDDPDVELFPFPVPPPMDSNNIPVKGSGFVSKLMIGRLNNNWQKTKPSFGEDDYKNLHTKYWNENTTGISTFEIEEPQLKSLLSKCKRNVVTLTHLLTACFQHAQLEVMGISPDYGNKVTISVNLRNRLTKPVGKTYGYYASAVTIQHMSNLRKSIWENATKLKNLVDRKLTDKNLFESQQSSELDPTLFDAMGLGLYGMLNHPTVDRMTKRILDDRMSQSIITNLGAHTMKPQVEALYGPVLHSFSEKYVGIVTVNGKLTIVASYNEKDISKQTVDAILRVTADTLNRL